MEKLIKALQIFLKYQNNEFPTHCEHDVMLVCHLNKEEVSLEDTDELLKLGFIWMDEYDAWGSYTYGSC